VSVVKTKKCKLFLGRDTFSTSKVHVIRTKDDACKPYKDHWLTFAERKTNFLLSDFDIQMDYFPLKIK
jgi:hypothetical protein